MLHNFIKYLYKTVTLYPKKYAHRWLEQIQKDGSFNNNRML